VVGDTSPTLSASQLASEQKLEEMIAQALDYASWVEQLTSNKLAQIYQRLSNGDKLDEAFQTFPTISVRLVQIELTP
jgi:hypothetical protein